MEEILVVFLQLCIETLLNVFTFVPLDVGIAKKEDHYKPKGAPPNYFSWLILAAVLGAILSAISLKIFPAVFIKVEWGRIMYLVLAPIAGAVTSYWFTRAIADGDRNWYKPKMHAVCALIFSVVFVTIRFTYASR